MFNAYNRPCVCNEEIPAASKLSKEEEEEEKEKEKEGDGYTAISGGIRE